MPICIIWVIASIIGFAVQAFAATPTGPTGLRGSQSPAALPVTANLSNIQSRTQSLASPQNWLGTSIWRAGPCDSAQNFQTFSFSTAPKVEVGSGKRGDGAV